MCGSLSIYTTLFYARHVVLRSKKQNREAHSFTRAREVKRFRNWCPGQKATGSPPPIPCGHAPHSVLEDGMRAEFQYQVSWCQPSSLFALHIIQPHRRRRPLGIPAGRARPEAGTGQILTSTQGFRSSETVGWKFGGKVDRGALLSLARVTGARNLENGVVGH